MAVQKNASILYSHNARSIRIAAFHISILQRHEKAAFPVEVYQSGASSDCPKVGSQIDYFMPRCSS